MNKSILRIRISVNIGHGLVLCMFYLLCFASITAFMATGLTALNFVLEGRHGLLDRTFVSGKKFDLLFIRTP